MNIPRALSLTFLVAFLGACGGGSGPAAPPQAAWSQPTPIVTIDDAGRIVAVQPDAAGGLVMEWAGTLPEFAYRQPSGSWTRLPTIPTDACSTQAWTMGASGIDSVLLSQKGSESTSTLVVTRFSSGAWSAPTPVAVVEEGCYATGNTTYDAQRRLAFRRGGYGYATITRYDPAAGGWQPVEQLSTLPGTTRVDGPGGVIAADGLMVATWRMTVNGHDEHVYHTFRPGKGWSEPVVLPGVDEFGAAYKILAGVGGNFVMAYTGLDTRPHEMLLSRFNIDTGWEAPVLVGTDMARSSRGFQLLGWDVHQGESGHILATWTKWVVLPGGSIVTEAWSRFYDPATGWAPSVSAPSEVTDSVGTAIRISPSGKVIVASERGISTLDGNNNWVTVDPPPPRPNRGNSFNTYFVIEPTGAITAVWDERSENNRTTFMSSTYR